METEAEKDAYIQQYYDREGILLDKDNIRVNKGLRLVAKLLLNSLWVGHKIIYGMFMSGKKNAVNMYIECYML